MLIRQRKNREDAGEQAYRQLCFGTVKYPTAETLSVRFLKTGSNITEKMRCKMAMTAVIHICLLSNFYILGKKKGMRTRNGEKFK